jgi:hypothetical protein
MSKDIRQLVTARMPKGERRCAARTGQSRHGDDRADAETGETTWTTRLVLFLRVMAVLSMIKGLYHWAQITGFIGGEEGAFEAQTTQWQTATVYFAVIELVAAAGLWLATPWGAVVWLTTIVSTAVIELMFPAIYGGNLFAVLVSLILLAAYLITGLVFGTRTAAVARSCFLRSGRLDVLRSLSNLSEGWCSGTRQGLRRSVNIALFR